MRNNPTFGWAAIAAVLLALGCARKERIRIIDHPFYDLIPLPPLPTQPARLVGTRWRLLASGQERIADLPGSRPVTLEIGVGAIGGHSGCNNYGAAYRVEEDQFVPSPIEADGAACADPVGAVERRLFETLGSPFWTLLEAGHLKIWNSEGPPLFFVPLP
jgi:heat shock protein HslJ